MAMHAQVLPHAKAACASVRRWSLAATITHARTTRATFRKGASTRIIRLLAVMETLARLAMPVWAVCVKAALRYWIVTTDSFATERKPAIRRKAAFQATHPVSTMA